MSSSSRLERRAAGRLRLAAPLVLVLGPLVLYPLGRLVWLSVEGSRGVSLEAYRSLLGSGTTAALLAATLELVTASAGIASILGVALAAALHFRPFVLSAVILRFLELFVAFPSFLVAFALIFLYGTEGSISIALMQALGLPQPPLDFLFGFGGIVLAEVVFYAPFVVRPTLAALALIDRRLIEAALSLGAGPVMVARQIVVPLAWPGIAAGIVMCFLLTLNEFGILLVLGSARLVTLPVAIWSAATVDLDLRTASAEAVLLLGLSLLLYALYRAIERRALGRYAGP